MYYDYPRMCDSIMKSVIILGATGSIGRQALEVCKKYNINVSAISFGNNLKDALDIIKEFNVKSVWCLNELDLKKVRDFNKDITLKSGTNGLKELIFENEGNVLNGITGIAGLLPSYYTILAKKDLYLANKESMVVAGDIINDLARKNNVNIIPVDSEHNAIYRLLKNVNSDEVKKIIITASGGAFRDYNRNELENVTINEALKHPNWSMGKKITVDCASMVNKGLEVIEAHHLFNMPYDKIDTVLHYESIIHSMVEYNDNSIGALMYNPSMIIPIQYALVRKISDSVIDSISFSKLNTLTFKPMDTNRYPMLELAYKVGKLGGFYPTIFNACNEACVDLFIQNKIKFLDIEKILFNCINSTNNINLEFNIDNILKVDSEIKKGVYNGKYN